MVFFKYNWQRFLTKVIYFFYSAIDCRYFFYSSAIFNLKISDGSINYWFFLMYSATSTIGAIQMWLSFC
jgi:hypothetical protein